MHHPHDQWFKALMRMFWERVAAVELERAVHVPPQRIDLAYEPRARAPELGIIDRIAAHGPGMLEYFATDPTDADIKSCIRKRLNYDHERALAARRRGAPAPPEPRLWLLTTTTPRAALRSIALVPMAGWPMGVWHVPADQQVHLVVLDELPRDRHTLPLRLLGRGATLQHAVADLGALRRDHILYHLARPVLIAYRPGLVQDLERAEYMYTSQEIMDIYEEWQQRQRAEGVREFVIRQLAHRFGAVPPEVAERIRGASVNTLTRLAERLATAQSIEDIAGEEYEPPDTPPHVRALYEEWERRNQEWEQEWERRRRAEGERAGMAHLLVNQLAHRFGALPPEVEGRIRRASADTLTRWAERVLTAPSIDDVLA